MSTKLTYDIAGWGDGSIYSAAALAQLQGCKNEMSLSEMNLERLTREAGVQHFVFRPQYPGVQDPRFPDQLPVAAALRYIDDVMTKPGWPRGHAWELLCEPECDTADKIDALCDYYSEAIDGLHARGEFVAAFSFSTGNPTPERLYLLQRPKVKALLQKFRKGDLVAVHEYFVNAGHALAVMRALPLQVDYALTEYGFDIAGDPSHNWHDQGISDDEYMRLLFANVERYDADPRCQVVTIFNWGDVGVYRGFDVSRLGGQISAGIAARGGGAPLVFALPAPWAPEPPEPPDDEPIVELTADYTRIQAGETVTLSWHIEHVQAAYLDGEGVTGPTGTRSYTLEFSRQFVLRAVLLDGTEQLAIVDVTVDAVPSDATEPSEPHLRAFPRPPNDNGRGFSFGLDNRVDKLEMQLPELAALGVKWVIFPNVGDELQAAECARRAWALGMMPIIRLKCQIDAGFPNWAGTVAAILEAGVPGAYVQIYNEPGDPREWKSGRYNHDVYVQNWHNAALQVIAAGGFPGLQSLDQADLQDALATLTPADQAKVFLCSHAYTSNHPPDYPYDKGLTVFDDDTCCLRFLEEAEWCKAITGIYPMTVVTEGGPVINQQEDSDYPRTDETLFAQYSVEIFEWFKGLLSNGQALPDWLFAYCMWLWSDPDYYGFSWRDAGTGAILRQPAVDAVKAIPAFVRTFGGAVPPEPPPDPELAAAIDAAERAEQSLEDALVDLQGVLGYLRSLEGKA